MTRKRANSSDEERVISELVETVVALRDELTAEIKSRLARDLWDIDLTRGLVRAKKALLFVERMKSDLDALEWRRLAYLPDYEVSERGDVRRVTSSKNCPAGYVFKGATQAGGYVSYLLKCSDGKRRTKQAHRLVCEAFHGPSPFVLAEVAHNDGDATNNHHSNLRWATHQENMIDRVEHGRIPRIDSAPDQMVAEIRARFTGRYGEVAALARQYGIDPGYAWRICHNKLRRHIGNAEDRGETYVLQRIDTFADMAQ